MYPFIEDIPPYLHLQKRNMIYHRWPRSSLCRHCNEFQKKLKVFWAVQAGLVLEAASIAKKK